MVVLDCEKEANKAKGCFLASPEQYLELQEATKAAEEAKDDDEEAEGEGKDGDGKEEAQPAQPAAAPTAAALLAKLEPPEVTCVESGLLCCILKKDLRKLVHHYPRLSMQLYGKVWLPADI